MGREVVPTGGQKEQTGADDDPAQREVKSEKILLVSKEAVAEQDADVTEVAERIGQVHQVADVAALPRHGDQPLEKGRLNDKVWHVQPDPVQNHESERRERAILKCRKACPDQHNSEYG